MKFTNKFIQKIKNDIVLYQRLIKDNRTPKLSKILLVIAIAYALSPIDIIPDFIPIIGYLDDLIIIPILVTTAVLFIPKSLIKEIKDNINA